MTAGLANPLSFDSWRKNGAPLMSIPLTEPRLHNSLAPSAEMYHSAATGASSTASMSEIDNVMRLIVNADRKTASLNCDIEPQLRLPDVNHFQNSSSRRCKLAILWRRASDTNKTVFT